MFDAQVTLRGSFLNFRVCPLRFLVYNPLYAKSHITFTDKTAETLLDAGHQVVIIILRGLLSSSQLTGDASPHLRTAALRQVRQESGEPDGARDYVFSDVWNVQVILVPPAEEVVARIKQSDTYAQNLWLSQSNVDMLSVRFFL